LVYIMQLQLLYKAKGMMGYSFRRTQVALPNTFQDPLGPRDFLLGTFWGHTSGMWILLDPSELSVLRLGLHFDMGLGICGTRVFMLCFRAFTWPQ